MEETRTCFDCHKEIPVRKEWDGREVVCGYCFSVFTYHAD